MAPSAAPCARALTRALLASTALVGVGLPLGLSLSPGPLRAEPLPRGGQVISGGVTIGTPQSGALAITQSSQTAIVDWQGFSVGQGHRVDIRQPGANAALLNRVTGATPSTIAGQLNATGQVYLVNPNGVTITRSGQVNAAGFVASSLGISDEDFKGGRRQFRGSGASAPVTNHGAITIGRGGYAALIGGSVSNTGTISVPMGRVGLGAGERATLDLSGDGFLQVAVPTRGRGRGALVAHSGTIAADGGSVTLSAAAARDMARQAVNLSGTVEARSVSGTNGRITLSGGEGSVVVGPTARLDASGAGAEAGGRVRVAGRHVTVAGTVDVSGATGGRARLKASEHLALSGRVLAEGRTGRGGRVVATAPEIATQAARIEASGAAGGGVVRVGGGRMGQGPLARAERVSVDAASVIRADATRAGVGGDVVVWSDGATRFSGTITARGGAAGGDGGQAEVSSKGVLSYEGRTDLTAAKGAFGTLLLDPYDVTITSGAQTTGGGFTATANGSLINATTLLTALGSANVTVSTGSGGGQAGAITLAASTPLAWNTGATLTLQAAGAVTLNSAVTAPAGGLTIAAEGGTSTATAGISVARFTLALGDWVQNTATLPGFAAGDFQVDGGSFLRAAGGAGTSASPYRLTDIYGVQGMGTSSAYQAASYQLAGDVDASGTVAWNGGAGFNPVGTFTGSLDGAGYAITGLTIARPSQDYVGLFGYVGSGGRVGNLGLVGGSVSGYDFVGALVGYNYAGTVSQSYATGTVSGSGNSVGGLVGYNDRGTVSRSYATGRVSGSFDVGGLVGTLTTGTVSQSYATGTVSGSGSYAGGLVGFNDRGTVSQSYATGTVSGSSSVGGLVGLNNIGTVSQSYAAGSVSGSSAVGGLAGHNGGTLTNTYWDTDSTGRMSGVGSGSSTGATGLTTAQARAASNYGGFDFSTVWYQAGDMRPILRSEAAPAVGGVSAVSNLHQLQLMGANLAGRYRLTANIDAVATSTTAASSGIWGTGGFVPVGESTSNPFTGSLDGAGYTITGLTITRPSQSYVGLFGIIGSGGRVGDFGLVGGSVSGNSAVGGLVGQNGGTVIQSYATGSVTGGAKAPSVGGLVGVNDSGGTVAQSYATGSVSGSGDYVGGLVGHNSGTISQSYATGSVTGSFYVGGLVGYHRGTVSEVYATGRVTGSSFVGGLFGGSIGALTNAYWDTDSTGMTSSGAGSSPGTTGLTTAQARVASNYGGFDLSTVWYQAGDMRPILRSEAAPADTSGVVAVSNLHQLQLMGANLAGRYRLTANIDAVATSTTAASSGIWGSGGFVPVGESTSNPFTGSLDGAGRTITGLTISRPSQDLAGLIGALGAGGRISGLGLVGDSVSGTSNVGGLVGTNAGSISQSYATGAASGSSAVGGLIGTNAGTISRSHATGAVSGSGAVGGLVGVNNGTISQSYAADSVFGITLVGGLVGVNGSRITQAYAAGDVSGSNTVGGLVGHNGNIISESYATGAVSGNTIAGGLVGRSTGGTLTSTYWNTATARQRDGVGNGPAADAIGLTTAQMQDLASFRANYAGFDFATVWAPPNQAGQGGLGSAFYPQLYGVSNVVAVTPSSSRTYGSGSAPVATYAGLRPGDFVTTLGTLSTGATASSDVGDYAVTASGAAVTGAAGTAYRVVYAPGTLSITPATITVAGATGLDKTYDRTTALPGGTPGFTSAGVLFGDAVTVSAGSAAYDSARAGTRSVIVSGLSLSGAKAGNYRLSAASVTGSGTIDPAALPVTGVRALDKIYDGTTAALLAGTASVTAQSGDVVSVSGTGTGTFADKNAGTGKAVTVGGYSLAGIDAGNYTLVQPSGLSADIARAPLPVSGLSALDKTYDGTTAATLAGIAAVTALSSDVVSVSGTGTGTFADKNAGLGKTVTVGGYSLAGIDAGNYTLVQPSGLSADIARAALAVSRLSALDKTYDGTTAAALAGTATVTPIGADLVALTGAVTGRFVRQTAGPGIPLILSGLGLTGLDAGNYDLSLPTLSAAISPAALTYTAAAAARTYGAANPTLAGTVTGFVAGESLSSATTGTLAFGTAATSASDVGTYAVSGFGLGTVDGNYVFVQAATNAGALTVDPALLSVSGSRSYDATTGFATAQLGVAGGQNGETVTLIRGSGTAASADAGLQAGSALAGLAVQVAGGNARAGNYRLPTTGTLSITPAPIGVTATGGRSTYGDAPADPGLSATGLQGGQDVRVLAGLSNGFGIDAATGAGRYGLVVVGALSNGNYTVAARTPGIWQVDPRPLTLTADAQSRVYGDADPALTYRIGGLGLVNGDRLSGGLASDADAASGVGRYAIGQGSLAASANYALTYQGAELTVTPRPVTLTGTRVYDAGAGIVGGALTAGNRVNGDAVTVSGSGTLAGRDVGLQALSDVSGLALSNPNYTLTGAGGAVTVTPATLTYTADAARRRYGAANPALSGTVTGLLGPDTLPGATTGRAFFATAAGTGSNVGVYAVTGAGLAAGNYVFVQAPGNADALTVDPAGLAVTGARTYDATTGFRFGQLAVSGGANGETLTLTAGAGVTASADAGLYADASLTGLTLSVAAGNGSAANYRLPATGTLAITPATVTVRVDDGRSTYGDAPAHPGLAATGLVGGQEAGVLTGLATGFDLDAASAAGRYTIAVAGRLSNGNYRVEGVEPGTYTIERRPLTVAADAVARVYGDATPVLTYTVGGRGLANGDRLTGDLATAAAASSDVGRYAIGQGTLAASADYALTWRGADLTVTPRPITVFADPQTRRAGTVNPSLTYTVGGRGLMAGDRLTGALATTAGAESEPGLYPITRGSLAASANYGLGFVGATLAVLPAQPQPQPRPVDSDPAGLASTAERAARRDARPVDPDPPLLLGASPDGGLRVSDPRFDAILACAGQQGGCFLTPLPRAPMALPAPVPAPTPQASLPANTR